MKFECFLNAQIIARKNEVNYFGMTLYSILNWKGHIKKKK